MIFDTPRNCRKQTVIKNIIRNEWKGHIVEMETRKIGTGARNDKSKLVTPFLVIDSKDNGQQQASTKIGTKTSMK